MGQDKEGFDRHPLLSRGSLLSREEFDEDSTDCLQNWYVLVQCV